MKIRGKDGQLPPQDAVKIITNKPGARNIGASGGNGAKATTPVADDGDKVDVSIASFINETLDPTRMAAERRKKIEALKKLIAAGEYKPSSQEVAQAVGEEVVFQILTDDSSKIELPE